MGFFGSDDKYADRAWDWAKQMSRETVKPWRQIFNTSTDAAMQGELTPWNQSVMDYSQQALSPYTQQQDVLQSDLYKNMEGLYSPWAQQSDPFQSDLYQGAEQLYQPTVDPLYNQLMPGLKRGIEGQYQNTVDQMLSTGASGGALSDMLANAAMSRSTSLGDMERGLRAQDISRLDQTQRDRAGALTGLAQTIAQMQQQGGLARAQGLSAGSVGLEQMKSNQGLMANQYLSGLLNQLSQSDIDRATNMANIGVQGRYMTGNQMAGSEAGSNAATTSGLMNMGSMLGLGLGSSGAFSGLGDIFGGLFGGGSAATMPTTMPDPSDILGGLSW